MKLLTIIDELLPYLSPAAIKLMNKDIPNTIYEYDTPEGRKCRYAAFINLSVYDSFAMLRAKKSGVVIDNRVLKVIGGIISCLADNEVIVSGSFLLPFKVQLATAIPVEHWFIGYYSFSDKSSSELAAICDCFSGETGKPCHVNKAWSQLKKKYNVKVWEELNKHN